MKGFKKYFVALLVLAAGLVWYAVYAETRDGLLVAFLDVGQGDAIYIEAPNGSQVLLDGGQNRSVLSELSKVMPFYDRSIDMVIGSHPDADHIGGLVEVVRRYNVGAMMRSGVSVDSAVYKELEAELKKKNIKKILARRGMRVNLGEGVYMDILFPDRSVSGIETNAASIIAKLVYGDVSFLLTGDAPKAIENYLVSLDKKNIDVDVLKLGHHGSKTSTSEFFVGYTSPEYAIVSAGADNRYGHPHAEVLEVLENFDVQVLRTDEEGTIKVRTDGENIFLE